MWSAGSYVYDYENQDFIYGGDTSAPIQIMFGKSKVINFEKFINSANPNFKWVDIRYPETTKMGGKLIPDESNKKIVTYIPNPKAENPVDEFDVEIIPGEFINKPNNYVSKYKLKIKFKQVANGVHYDTLNNVSLNDNIDKIVEKYEKNKSSNSWNASKIEEINFNKQNSLNKISFSFVSPETGTYAFRTLFSDKLFGKG